MSGQDDVGGVTSMHQGQSMHAEELQQLAHRLNSFGAAEPRLSSTSTKCHIWAELAGALKL